MNDKELWNHMAAHYQSTLHTKDESSYPDDLVAFLAEKGAAEPGSSVMDIGCGVGKYAIRFAARRCGVHMLDLADEMLKYARENMRAYDVPWRAQECDWEKTDVRKSGWEKSVDLAFAAMTPAVTELKGVLNMIAVSRRHCFISKFAGIRNHMNEKVYASLGQDAPDGNFDGKSWMHLANAVVDLGYFPEITYRDYAWENFIPLEQAVERFFDGYNMQLQDNAENRRRVRDALASITNEEGIVHEQVQSKAAWIYWDVTIN